MQHTIQQELKGVSIFVAIIWGVFLLECVLPFQWHSYGVTPRTVSGLIGIPLMPFLHGNLQHISSNTVPLFVLLILLAGSKTRSWQVVASIVLLGGGLLWLFGRPATHVGASGLIFGLIAYLVVSGWLERRFVPLMISVVVTFLYGGTLFWGMMPSVGTHVSWDGHLFGALAGCLIAFVLTKKSNWFKRTSSADRQPS